MSAITLIQQVVNPTSQSPLTLTSIPDTFDDLLLKVNLRVFRDGDHQLAYIQFNSDTTAANYRKQRLSAEYGYGVYAQYFLSQSSAHRSAFSIYNSQPSTMYSAGEILITDYTSSNPKITSSYLAAELNSSNGIGQLSNEGWAGTSAISSIRFYDLNGSNFMTNSTISLYGITKTP